MRDAFLSVEGLTKSYGGRAVLRGIDLAVRRHEVVCLIGASGSGKSTLLRCINALEPIDAGVVRLDGDPVSGPGVDVNLLRRRVGMVFQSYNLFPHLSVIENVMLAPVRVAGRSRAEARARAEALLERIGLGGRASDMPDRLSGGQQQRVAIIRAMAMDPEVLLLDEVTSALDPELVGEVLDILKELAQAGMTMVLATHEMGFARDVASEVCFLHQGRLIERGPPAQIFGAPAEEETRRFLRRAL
jgi:polar amino acid transport system ATP-binding protein